MFAPNYGAGFETVVFQRIYDSKPHVFGRNSSFKPNAELVWRIWADVGDRNAV